MLSGSSIIFNMTISISEKFCEVINSLKNSAASLDELVYLNMSPEQLKRYILGLKTVKNELFDKKLDFSCFLP